MRARALILPAVLAVLLAGCSGTPAPPTPTPVPTETTVGEPTTLEELADAVMEEGLVDMALFASGSGALRFYLAWEEPPSPDDQLAAFSEVKDRAGALVEVHPETTQFFLGTVPSGGRHGGVSATYDPGTDLLLALLETITDSPCQAAELNQRDYGEGPRAEVDLDCRVDADDLVGLASAYDEVTALRLDVDGVDETHWEVSVDGWSTSDALFRLDAGPIEGRQDLYVDLMTMATDGDADRLQIIDSGDSITVHGFAGAEQSQLCTTMHDLITAAGVEQSGVRMQLPESTPDEDWACYGNP